MLVNLQPAGEYLGEDFHRAGGVPAVVGELLKAGLLPYPNAITANGQTMGANCETRKTTNGDVIKTVAAPLMEAAGFINLKGNLFDSAIMKTSVISPAFRKTYLSNPDDLNAFEGSAIVFEGPEDYHHRIDDPAEGIDEGCILVMRGAGPKGYPGGAEVVNMRAPSYLLKQGVEALPCVGDGRQSGTSGSPSILNASPEAADNGGLAILRTGDQGDHQPPDVVRPIFGSSLDDDTGGVACWCHVDQRFGHGVESAVVVIGPIVDETGLEAGDGRAPDPKMCVSVFVLVSSVAQPFVGDANR